jgi:hypothetical protein
MVLDVILKYLPFLNTFLLLILVLNSNYARKENNTAKVQRSSR